MVATGGQRSTEMAEDRVLIAGAGPVGCVAALHLARSGIPVSIFEAEETLPLDLRASTFHPPTLDMLDDLGVVDALIGQGIICPTWQYRDLRQGVIAEWDLGVLKDDTRHPYRVQAEQYKLTSIIVEILDTMPNVEFRYQARATGSAQDADGVDLHLETPDGPEIRRGRYLIAADGASSVIRAGLGIDYPGLTFPEMWLCVSTEHDFGRNFENLSPIAYIADPDFWFVFVKVPGLWRLLMPSFPGESADSLVSDETVQERMRLVADIGADYPARHRTAYHIHQRVAERYRDGRVFLAGDSAHINNPLGGMGMNGGIHDAVNLCEKIAAVWRGAADDGELDRYDRQRRPIAIEYVQKATLSNKAHLEEKDPEIRRQRYELLRRTVNDHQKAREFLLQSSMIKALERAAALE
jgi:2-polyprenyl-6-methoxyphenol hydroxylase-like FAD-dependent oxidoreductase